MQLEKLENLTRFEYPFGNKYFSFRFPNFLNQTLEKLKEIYNPALFYNAFYKMDRCLKKQLDNNSAMLPNLMGAVDVVAPFVSKSTTAIGLGLREECDIGQLKLKIKKKFGKINQQGMKAHED